MPWPPLLETKEKQLVKTNCRKRYVPRLVTIRDKKEKKKEKKLAALLSWLLGS